MSSTYKNINYTGNASEIYEAFFQHVRAAHGDEPETMWRGRTQAMFAYALPAVMERCVHLGVDLTHALLKDWLSFPALVKMSQSPRISSEARTSLGQYLSMLPGFGTAGYGYAQKQHGYCLMQLNPALDNSRPTQAAA